jgi:uncharacterized RDD family membrane protein YckC
MIDSGYVGFWKRVWANVVEILILCIPFVYLYRYLIKLSVQIESIYPFVIYWIFYLSFMVFFIVKFGGTIGKLIFGYRIVDQNGDYLTISKAIIRLFPYMLNAVILSYSINHNIHNQVGYSQTYHNATRNEGFLSVTQNMLGFLMLVDQLTVAFNRKKRAIHDIIAGSYVITRSKLMSIRETPAATVPTEILYKS